MYDVRRFFAEVGEEKQKGYGINRVVFEGGGGLSSRIFLFEHGLYPIPWGKNMC